MKQYKYELVLKETIIDGDSSTKVPDVVSSIIVDDKILNGFSYNRADARIHLVRRLFMELLRSMIK